MKATPKRRTPEEKAIREAVYQRDGGCVLAGLRGAGPCFGGLSPHHILKEGQGGAYTMTNLVALCVGHNDGIEAHAELAELARTRGLVRYSWETDEQWAAHLAQR